MFRPTVPRITSIAICLAVMANWAFAGDPLEIIPGNALGFVVINRLGQTDAKLAAIGAQLQLPTPSVLAWLDTKGDLQEGIDKTAAAAFALIPAADDTPLSAVLYVPVTDYARFVQQLDVNDANETVASGRLFERPVIVGQRNGYALIMGRPGDREILDGILQSEDSHMPVAAQQFKEYIAKQDIAAVLTPSGVKLLTGAGQQGLDYIKRGVENASDEQKQSVLMGITVYEQLFRGVEAEVESVAVGATIKTDGEIRFSKQVLFQESGKVATILSELKPTSYDFFAGFPQIPYVCAFGFELPSASFGPMMEMSASLMKSMPQLYGLEPEQVDKMMELSKEKFSDMQGMSFLWGVGQPGASMYSGLMGAIRVGDATTYVKRYLEFWNELKGGIGAAKGSFFDMMSVQSIEIDGKPAFKLTMQIPGMFGASGQRSEKIEAEMKKIFGPDGNVTAYFAAGDARTVLFSYTDDTLLREGYAPWKTKTTCRTKQVSCVRENDFPWRYSELDTGVLAGRRPTRNDSWS